mgnify:CR=1 FL=1
MSKDGAYKLEDFMKDIKTGLEIEFTFNGKKYTLSRSDDKYAFTDVREQNYALYYSYEELLESIRIEGFSIIDIIDKRLYQNWYVY